VLRISTTDATSFFFVDVFVTVDEPLYIRTEGDLVHERDTHISVAAYVPDGATAHLNKDGVEITSATFKDGKAELDANGKDIVYGRNYQIIITSGSDLTLGVKSLPVSLIGGSDGKATVMSGFVDNGVAEVTFNVATGGDNPALDFIAIIAVYDSKGRMVSILQRLETVAPGGQISFALQASLPAGCTAKAFIWDNNYAPLCSALDVI
jgi:hypothetical protein